MTSMFHASDNVLTALAAVSVCVCVCVWRVFVCLDFECVCISVFVVRATRVYYRIKRKPKDKN